MTNEQWQTAIETAEELSEIAKDNQSMEWFSKIEEYYIDNMEVRI